MSNSRNSYFDFIRGLAIIMVIGIHTMMVTPDGLHEAEDFLILLVRMTLNCAVPLFLAISGFFVGSKNISFGRSHFEFLRHQLPKVYIPCLIFSLPYLLIYCFSDGGSIIKGILLTLTCSFSIYYFIALIIQFYLLIPLFNKMNNIAGLVLTTLLSVVSIVGVTYLLKILHLNLPLIIYAGPFPVWVMFFFIGMFLSSRSRGYGILGPMLLTTVGMALQFIEYSYWHNQGEAALGIKLTSFVFSLGVVLLFFSRKMELTFRENSLTRPIVYVGFVSFGIYLIHCYNNLIISKLPPPIVTMPWLLRWGVVLVMSIAVIWLLKLICPGFAKKYLGFR